METAQTIRFRRTLGVIRLIRPLNFVLFFFGVLVGAWLASGREAFSDAHRVRLVIAMVSAASIGAAANAINDYFDRTIDRVNRPDRPLVSGVLHERTAVLVWAAGSAIGIGLGFVLGLVHVLIAIASVLLTFLYSTTLKKSGLPGNIVVGLVVACAVFYGALATGRIGFAWIGAFFAFLTMVAREIVKDVEDLEGDRAVGIRTLPDRIGIERALVVASFPIVFAMLVSPLPFLVFGFGGWYLVWLVPSNLVLLYALWCLFGNTEGNKRFSKASGLIKAGVILGILALMSA
jgi:geranylgeranylglycerol-phosphate geranylgeranyltransferase